MAASFRFLHCLLFIYISLFVTFTLAEDPTVSYNFELSYITASPLGVPQQLKGIEQVVKMLEHKWNPVSIEQGSLTSLTPKRHKAGLSMSPKERKEKVGERIAALQQLVSPYGKTDTASVLLEAVDYIHFLHDQVKVLSAPYLLSNPTSQSQECEPYNNLKGKGLCLVPVSYTMGIARSNGADIWAPIKTTSPKS